MGTVLGDRGGGYDLARQGLRLVLSHYDLEQKITPLAERILRELSLNTLADLVGLGDGGGQDVGRACWRPPFSPLRRLGEPEMLRPSQLVPNILAEFTRAVALRLDFPTPPVKLIGGLFTHHAEYVALFKYRLSVLLPGAVVELCEDSGALGAAWLAA